MTILIEHGEEMYLLDQVNNLLGGQEHCPLET